MASIQATKIHALGQKKVLTVTKDADSTSTSAIRQEKQPGIVTSTSQEVDEKQSTQLVQTLLHGSLSVLSYLRNLFPEKCFDEHVYLADDVTISYMDYAVGQSGKNEKMGEHIEAGHSRVPSKRPGTKIKMLRRGRSSAVDEFLDLLEIGVFEALELKVLRAIQLSIFEDPNSPSNVVETYTFTINYSETSMGNKAITGLDIKGPRGEAIAIRTAKYALQMFIRRLITLCSTLPDLPERRFLNIHLFYNESCEPGYEPPGFSSSSETTIQFPDGNGWSKSTQSCGILNAGYLQTSLTVSHLAPLNELVPINLKTGNPIIKGDLNYTCEGSRMDDIAIDIDSVIEQTPCESNGLSQEVHIVDSQERYEDMSVNEIADDMETVESPCKDVMPEAQNSQGTLSRFYEDEIDLDGDKSAEERIQKECNQTTTRPDFGDCSTGNITKCELTTEVSDTQATTQLPGDLETKRMLQNMLQPSPINENLEETQPISTFQITQELEDRILRKIPVPELSSQKLEELKYLKKQHGHTSDDTQQVRWGINNSRNDVINCQCGWNEEGQNMINCDFCDTWQHLECYGYRNSNDPRIPREHACYRCLLQANEKTLLCEMEGLALLRKAICVAESVGYSSDKSFSELLHCDMVTASRAAKHLRKEGFLLATSGSHSKGFHLTGKPRFYITREEPRWSQMLNQYFDPIAKIAHHFKVPPSGLCSIAPFTQVPSFPPRDSENTNATAPNTTTMSSQDKSQQMSAATAPHAKNVTRSVVSPGRRNILTVERSSGGDTGERRYSLRYRSTVVPDSQEPPTIPTAVTPGKKRSLDANGDRFEKSTPSRKRTKSSISKGLIKIGYTPSPTPGPSN